MRDAPDTGFARGPASTIAEFAFNRAVVALLVHVDEVDDDQAGEIAQAQLSCDFLGSLKVVLSAVSSM